MLKGCSVLASLVVLGCKALAISYFGFSYSDPDQSATGYLWLSDQSFALSGVLNISSGVAAGSYYLRPNPVAPDYEVGQPFVYDNWVGPTSTPQLDASGLLFENSAGAAINIYNYTSSVTQYSLDYFDGTTYAAFDDYVGTFNGSVQPAPTPEPATLALLGLARLAIKRRKN